MNAMPLWFAVAVGSALGGLARFLLSRAWPAAPGTLPLATMGVNVAGCFAIGVLSVLLGRNAQGAAVAESWRVFWLSGVLGGFTTWSAFALESVLLTSEGASMKALAYVLLTVMGCLLAAWIGRSVGLAMSG